MNKNVELYNLTNPQLSLWNIEQFYPGTSINNICGIVQINEKVNFINLEKAINLVVKNNDGMRIRLDNSGNTIAQYIATYSSFNIDLLTIDAGSLIETGKTLVKESFSILDGPLYNFKMFQSKDGTNGVIILLYHLIADAWTINFIASQILSYYKQLQSPSQPELANYSYIDYIATEQSYLNSDKFIKDKFYWEEYFNYLPEITSLKSEENFSIDSNRKEFVISGKAISEINAFCSQNNISQYIFFLSLYSIYFRNILNTKNYIIGNPILNRSNFSEKNTVGTFINTAPFIVQINDDDDFIQNCINLSSEQKQMYRHIRYPLTLIQQYVKKKHSNNTNLFDIIFSYQNAKVNVSTDDINYNTYWIPNGQQVESIMVHIKDTDNTGNVYINYDYLTSVFSENEITLLHERILNILNQVLKSPNMRMGDIDIVTESEKKHLLYNLNDTKMEYDKKLTIVNLFEKQVMSTPENIAVTAGINSLTYRELNLKANFLATKLKDSGVSLRRCCRHFAK